MFTVMLGKSCHVDHRINTRDSGAYLLDFARFIVRTVPDAEVHARLGDMAGDEAVFRGCDADCDDGMELF
jgi:hypothetical protein